MGASSTLWPDRGDFAADAIENEVADLEALRRRLAAAEQRAHAGQQFDEGEWFDQVVVGAAFEAFDAVVDSIARAEDQDRRTGLAIANLLQQFEAVHVGEHEIENDQVILGCMDLVERGSPAGGAVHRIVGAFQAAADEVGDLAFVFDNEDSHCCYLT